MARQHYSSRLEDWFNAGVQAILRRRGWRERIIPHVGYGNQDFVRVLARVVLSRDPRNQPRYDEDQVVRGWKVFVTAPATGVQVSVTVAGETFEAITDRGGFVDLSVPVSLEPGWHEISLGLNGDQQARGKVHVVDPTATFGLVSDIDDTVIETMLPRPLLAFRNAFLTRENARLAVPGMSALYAEISAAHPDVFVVYLSTGAWNIAVPLNAFLARHGYPDGPLLLTDWGPTREGWFRSGQDHKRTQLHRLFEELPQLRWLLVGDDGQHDPSLYAEATAAAPGKVLGVAIRQLSLTQQVIVHGNATAPDVPVTGTGDAVPVLAPDGFGLAEGLRARGIVLGQNSG
jgi:phosphatidate phosphatase APP1